MMAKAFTEQERIKIKEKILESALDLFHDKGTKALSIAELTKRTDKKGLLNAFSGIFLLCSHYYQFNKDYFNEILLTFISGIVNKYIEK
ncbi:hypothetical protein HMPREF9193_01205 [Treponema lecithinolyticum ATCC 700332]|uniref:HTH tetR-type domain-containing protein n=2 Tax=Treponema lecithinolyticum TaxID=53418 RepID=A0ABN0NZ38_TRELE|nr:hypothetical protein HMPREF9193_01205 [Treponema lecithinolyticum ATCC 700332]